MSVKDCLSFEQEVGKMVAAFTVFSREEEEPSVSLSLDEDEDACSAAYCAHTKLKKTLSRDYISIFYF